MGGSTGTEAAAVELEPVVSEKRFTSTNIGDDEPLDPDDDNQLRPDDERDEVWESELMQADPERLNGAFGRLQAP